jgi:hypothetical protein
MTRDNEKLHRAFRDQKRGNKQTELEIRGSLGIPLGGQKLVEVPNRASFVYVRLRDTQNEVIQAFNNQVAASYNLPVIVVRDGTRYKVIGVDTARYQDNWNNSSPYLPKHGHSHSFSESGGADTTFVFSRQIMPMLVYPSSQFTGTNVTVGAHTLLNNNQVWKYVGGTGTQSLLSYLPTGGNDAVMVLIYMDADTGNPGVLVGSGSYFSNLLTGTGDIYQYIPRPNPATQIPLSAVRLSSGTNVIDWTNLYDVRQWLQTIPTGTGGSTVFSGVDQIGIFGQDEGVPVGTGTVLNFVGPGVDVSRSGTVLRVFVTGTSGAGGESVLGSNFDITGSAGTFQDTGLSITLPSAGTYFIYSNASAVLKPTSGTSWFIVVKLYNSTDAADVSNSERMCTLTYTVSDTIELTGTINITITVAASKVIKLYAKRDGTGTPVFTASAIFSDSNGRTNLGYIKIS